MKKNCEDCMNFAYDFEYECNTCLINLDEDEYSKFLQDTFNDCPYFKCGNDYTIVKKQN